MRDNKHTKVKLPSLPIMVAILLPLVISISLSMDIYIPSLPLITHVFNVTQSQVQWTLSIYMFGVGFGQLLVGPLSDAWGRRKIAIFGLIIYCAGCLLAIKSPDLTVLILARALQSLGSCCAIVVSYAVVRDLYDTETGGKVYSVLNAVTAVAPVVAPLIGGQLEISFHTWKAAFVLLGLIGLLSLLIVLFWLPETHAKQNRHAFTTGRLVKDYASILSNLGFLKNVYTACVCMTILFCFCSVSPYLLIKQLHGSLHSFGFSFGSNAVVLIIANLLSASLTHRYKLRVPLFLGVISICVGSGIMLIMGYTHALQWWSFMPPMYLISLGVGLCMGPSAAAALSAFKTVAGSSSALLNGAQFLVAGFLGTLLMQYKMQTTIPFAGLMLGLSVVALLWQWLDRARGYEQNN